MRVAAVVGVTVKRVCNNLKSVAAADCDDDAVVAGAENRCISLFNCLVTLNVETE